MNPIEFKGQNVVFGEGQEEYRPLPALKTPDGTVITCWEISDEEWEEISRSRKIYLSQLTFNMPLQPVLLMSDLSGLSQLVEE